jgi:hypothetical protein
MLSAAMLMIAAVGGLPAVGEIPGSFEGVCSDPPLIPQPFSDDTCHALWEDCMAVNPLGLASLWCGILF